MNIENFEEDFSTKKLDIDFGSYKNGRKGWWFLNRNGRKEQEGFFYIIPKGKITKEMIQISGVQNFKPRNSIRPIDGSIYELIQFEDSIPLSVSKFKGLRVSKMREYLNSSKDWNIVQPLEELRTEYSFEKIILNFKKKYYLEAFGKMYIFIFQLLKYLFFRHSFQYLQTDIKKWQVFKQTQFEGANEYTLLQMCFFYDLINSEDQKSIDSFRIVRNQIMHSYTWTYKDEELLKHLKQMNKLFILLNKQF